MGNTSFTICQDCKYTAWLEDYELLEFIRVHCTHVIAIFPSSALDDAESFERIFRAFLGWPVEVEV
ncbi:hypothetical protein ES705_31591 [subsurface metagenome]